MGVRPRIEELCVRLVGVDHLEFDENKDWKLWLEVLSR